MFRTVPMSACTKYEFFFSRPGRDSAGADSPRHRHSTGQHLVVCRMDRTHLRARYRTWKVALGALYR